MSDVRALLRAKRQEVRVSHPLASYTSGGQLRCIACGTIVKHGTSWEGHIGSKAHRTNAARRREEERRHEEERARQRKRKAEDADADEEDADDADDATPSSKKQRMEEEEEEEEQRDVPQPAVPARPAGFPADFFSNPSRAPPPPSDDDGSDDETAPPAAAAAAAAAPSAIDAEWEQFQAAVIDAPDAREAYERATVFAEPVLSVETLQGFPAREGPADGETEERPVVPDEGELRRRRGQEERELIMDRLLEEEQAQEEADAKVSVLKNKLDALKKQREAARAAKGKQKRS
ncbi:hypothetical protein AcV7_006854 [Taiwanofungus camphoratus]|nr:hypothetical protein AcV7_006854 [Antrodia cinnamomea]